MNDEEAARQQIVDALGKSAVSLFRTARNRYFTGVVIGWGLVAVDVLFALFFLAVSISAGAEGLPWVSLGSVALFSTAYLSLCSDWSYAREVSAKNRALYLRAKAAKLVVECRLREHDRASVEEC